MELRRKGWKTDDHAAALRPAEAADGGRAWRKSSARPFCPGPIARRRTRRWPSPCTNLEDLVDQAAATCTSRRIRRRRSASTEDGPAAAALDDRGGNEAARLRRSDREPETPARGSSQWISLRREGTGPVPRQRVLPARRVAGAFEPSRGRCGTSKSWASRMSSRACAIGRGA